MDFNSFIFPAPTEDKYKELSIHKNELLFVPKKLKGDKLFHIPCLYQQSKYNPNTNKVFLYFHCNAEDIFNAYSNLSFIKSSLPFHTVNVEYPGYSVYYQNKSAETMEEDSLTVFDFLVYECHFKPKNIIVCGRSIGTGVATYLASKRNPGALILISPIKSLQDAAKGIVGGMKFLVKDRFNNYERIKDVTCPLLLVHGQSDNFIPFQQSIELSERTSGPYELILPEKMGHNEISVIADFLEPITKFLKRHNLLATDNSEIVLKQEYFQLPDYLKDKEHLNNMDRTSDLIRKLLKI